MHSQRLYGIGSVVGGLPFTNTIKLARLLVHYVLTQSTNKIWIEECPLFLDRLINMDYFPMQLFLILS